MIANVASANTVGKTDTSSATAHSLPRSHQAAVAQSHTDKEPRTRPQAVSQERLDCIWNTKAEAALGVRTHPRNPFATPMDTVHRKDGSQDSS